MRLGARLWSCVLHISGLSARDVYLARIPSWKLSRFDMVSVHPNILILEFCQHWWYSSGTLAHLSFTFLAVVNNLFNTINMILGASSAITYLSVRQKSSKSTSGKSANLSSTGMHIMASTFLLPLGVVIYTLTGGIKATYELAYFYWEIHNANWAPDFWRTIYTRSSFWFYAAIWPSKRWLVQRLAQLEDSMISSLQLSQITLSMETIKDHSWPWHPNRGSSLQLSCWCQILEPSLLVSQSVATMLVKWD